MHAWLLRDRDRVKPCRHVLCMTHASIDVDRNALRTALLPFIARVARTTLYIRRRHAVAGPPIAMARLATAQTVRSTARYLKFRCQ